MTCLEVTVHIIYTCWTTDFIHLALSYWVVLSKGRWSELTGQSYAYKERVPNATCFHQVDLLVHALFDDPRAAYCPTFILLLPNLASLAIKEKDVYLSRKRSMRHQSLLANWPTSCGSNQCPDPDCSALEIKTSYALHARSNFVRWDQRFPRFGGRFCNR
jgi:hypothetical protein